MWTHQWHRRLFCIWLSYPVAISSHASWVLGSLSIEQLACLCVIPMGIIFLLATIRKTLTGLLDMPLDCMEHTVNQESKSHLFYFHDDVIKWKRFPRYWPFVREFIGNRWILLTKASDAELWCFLWTAPWTNRWENNREASDLRRHRAHYDAIVMASEYLLISGLSQLFLAW